MKIPFQMFFVRAKRFLRENPAAVFILGFQVLLVTCAVLLVSGLSFIAEGLAVAAYFLLVAAVVVQLVSFLRGRGGVGTDG
jgi:hypothetical protein